MKERKGCLRLNASDMKGNGCLRLDASGVDNGIWGSLDDCGFERCLKVPHDLSQIMSWVCKVIDGDLLTDDCLSVNPRLNLTYLTCLYLHMSDQRSVFLCACTELWNRESEWAYRGPRSGWIPVQRRCGSIPSVSPRPYTRTDPCSLGL